MPGPVSPRRSRAGDSQQGGTIPVAAAQLLLAANPLPMWVYDLETLRFLEVNRSALTTYGYSRERFLQMRITDIRPAEELPRLRADLLAPRPDRQRSGPWRHRTADGTAMDVVVTSHLVEWEGRPAALVVAEGMPRTVAASGQTSSSTPPAATGTAGLAPMAREVVARGITDRFPAVVMVVRCDHLDSCMAAIGVTGVYALREQLTQRIRRLLPAGSLMAAEGEDFWVVCPHVEDGRARRLAGQLVLEIPRPVDLPGVGEIVVSASVGVRIAGPGPKDADALLMEASVAMRVAAAQGGGRVVVFDPSVQRVAAARFVNEQALRQALRAGEFCVHYQPIVDLASGEVHGFEALLRWQRPGHGVVGPEYVIGAAEESGLIVPIGAWVLNRALADFRALQREAPNASVAVNLSPHQLRDRGLVGRLKAGCAKEQIDPRSICLELTETALVRVGADVSEYARLLALRDTGVSLAVDDFGTGYSALAYLKQLPIDIVKIDRSFVADVVGNSADMVLIDAIVRIAHALGLRVVGEGVETVDQALALHDLGVDLAQGYFFGRPVPLASVARVLKGGSRSRYLAQGA